MPLQQRVDRFHRPSKKRVVITTAPQPPPQPQPPKVE